MKADGERQPGWLTWRMDGYSSPQPHFEKCLLCSKLPAVFFPGKENKRVLLTLLPRRGLSGIVSLDELPVYYESLWENRICTAQGASSCYSIYQPPSGYLDQQWLSQRAVLHSKPAPLTGLLT